MKIGLGLIVRNEEKDLPRCLETFLPTVDCAVILDTGSTDRTMAVAEDLLKRSGIKYILKKYLDASDEQGRLCDFSKARNEYIKILEENMDIDYIVSADADDIYLSKIRLHEYIALNPADVYAFKYWITDHQFFMSYKLWRVGHGINYAGRVHEVLNFSWNLKIVPSEIEIKHHVEHHEGQEHGTERNMRILRQEIYPPLRSLFYWANENVDCGNHKEAIKWYLEYIRRCKEGEACWNVELAHCFWRAARWLQHLGDFASSDLLCHELIKHDPSWSEAWCQLAYNARCRNDLVKCKEYALKALGNTFEPRLFSEMDKYTSTPANLIQYCNLQEKLSEQKEVKNE